MKKKSVKKKTVAPQFVDEKDPLDDLIRVRGILQKKLSLLAADDVKTRSRLKRSIEQTSEKIVSILEERANGK